MAGGDAPPAIPRVAPRRVRPRVAAWIVVAGFVALAAGARAQDGGGEPLAREVDRLLAQVASDDYAQRAAAWKRLAAIAREARPLLVARRDDADPEVRRTVESLLASLGEPDGPPVPAGVLGDLGIVAFAADEAPLAEVLARWGAEVGGSVRVPPAAAGAKVALAAGRRPYFAALDAILAAGAVELTEGFDEAGQGVAQNRPPNAPAVPSTASGPFRLDVTSIVSERILRPAPRTALTLRLRVLWSPALQVTSLQSPTVVRCVDGEGRLLRGAQNTVVYGVGRTRNATPEVAFQPFEGSLPDALAELALTMNVRARHGAQAVLFEDLAAASLPAKRSAAGAAPGAGETTVTVTAFGADPDHAGWARAEVMVALARGVPADSVSVALEARDGTARPLFDLSNRIAAADGTLQLTVRAPNLSTDPAGQRLRVTWYTREEELAVPFVLKDVRLR